MPHARTLAAGAAAALAILLLTAAPIPARTSPANMTRVNDALDDLHQASAAAHFDRYFAHFADGAVFLGTDDTERWNLDEFKAFAQPHFDKGTGWAYTPLERHIFLNDDETVAWFDERLENKSLGVCRGSGVLTRAPGGPWLITQYNLTIPIPNDLADRVVAMIREHR